DSATAGIGANRKLSASAVTEVLNASPQFASDVRAKGLIDKIGFDDEAADQALARAGNGARFEQLATYARATDAASNYGTGTHIALVEGSGEIVDGSADGGVFGGKTVIAGDDYARAIREATRDKSIKAILLRVDSPGGSVTASAQILDAIQKAQAAGKPVVVSMGTLAASGGYYISCSADKIVAEPATLTGSIGVLTGKVSIGKSLKLAGVTADEIGVGKNALFDSAITPYTDQQWQELNAEADVIYNDFMAKVAKGRHVPLATVQNIAKGRVWTGADAAKNGLVDELGGFWTAVDALKKLARIPAGERVILRQYPRPKSFFDVLNETFDDSAASMRVVQGLSAIANTPAIRSVIEAASAAPEHGISLRATGLPAGQ
ncbi:MAG TPA: signal peptide peptidase SppA, partial [Rhizomicrobium sp.]|nr:signal peptide peptidase SppA [Rhizomicrobium sp.]